jgi:hypothetical protein
MHVTLFDCEHLTTETSPQRYWCGPEDPDPLLVQIGAVHLLLEPPFALGGTFDCIVQPCGRNGPIEPSPFFSRLTGIDADRIAREARSLADALQAFAEFAGDAPIYSWGKDEITSIAPSCFVTGVACPIPVTQFRNAAGLLLRAGVAMDIVGGLRSHTLPAHFGLEPEPRGHDGVADARGVARVLSFLLSEGRLTPSDIAPDTRGP